MTARGPDHRYRLDAALAADHAGFEFDDAAYLLDALPAEQRAAFERHLARCPVCRDRVTELGDLPAALSRVEVSAVQPPQPAPDSLLPRLLRQVAAHRRHRARRAAVLATVAACLLALLATGGMLGWQHTHQPRMLAMASVGPNAAGVHASVQLIGSGSAIRVRLTCGYPAGSGSYSPAGPPSYRMVIVNRRGERIELGSWSPQPDEDVQLTRTSPWPRQNISAIEVSDDRGRAVLRLRL